MGTVFCSQCPMCSGRGFESGVGRLMLEHQRTELCPLLLKATPQGDVSCLGGGDGNVHGVSIRSQGLVVLAMLCVP